MPWKNIFYKMGEGENRSRMSGRWEFEEKYLNDNGEGTLGPTCTCKEICV